jgi:hypothetical protein
MTSPSLHYDALQLEAEHLRRPHRRSSQKTPKTQRQPCSNAARVFSAIIGRPGRLRLIGSESRAAECSWIAQGEDLYTEDKLSM